MHPATAPRRACAPRRPAPSRRAALLACLLLVVSTGCESTTRTEDLAEAMSLYRQGDFAAAYDRAEPLAESRSQQGAEAAYIAGLAAYRMDRLDDAERRFVRATQSGSRETAGQAYAMLGTIRQRAGRHREAAADFKAAAERLEGEQGARAAFEAGLALRAAGDPVNARSMLIVAASRSDGSVGRDAERELDATGWMLQVGAFRDRRNAEELRSRIDAGARARGMLPVRILDSRDPSGALLYTVCIGSFSSRRAAESARADLGRLDAWVVPAR